MLPPRVLLMQRPLLFFFLLLAVNSKTLNRFFCNLLKKLHFLGAHQMDFRNYIFAIFVWFEMMLPYISQVFNLLLLWQICVLSAPATDFHICLDFGLQKLDTVSISSLVILYSCCVFISFLWRWSAEPRRVLLRIWRDWLFARGAFFMTCYDIKFILMNIFSCRAV